MPLAPGRFNRETSMPKPFLLATTAILLATSAMAETKYPAILEGHAVLPALTLVPPPADAPEQLKISGRYAGPPGQRVDTPESVPGISALSDKATPRPTGISLPLKGQPVQGLSGIKNMKDGTFLTLTDNGFGSKANSPDAMLMFHVLKPDWKTGAVERVSTTFLHDPDRKVPFRIVNENTAKRYLTGSDFDIESIQPIGEALWFGDEFGAWRRPTASSSIRCSKGRRWRRMASPSPRKARPPCVSSSSTSTRAPTRARA